MIGMASERRQGGLERGVHTSTAVIAAGLVWLGHPPVLPLLVAVSNTFELDSLRCFADAHSAWCWLRAATKLPLVTELVAGTVDASDNSAPVKGGSGLVDTLLEHIPIVSALKRRSNQGSDSGMRQKPGPILRAC